MDVLFKPPRLRSDTRALRQQIRTLRARPAMSTPGWEDDRAAPVRFRASSVQPDALFIGLLRPADSRAGVSNGIHVTLSVPDAPPRLRSPNRDLRPVAQEAIRILREIHDTDPVAFREGLARLVLEEAEKELDYFNRPDPSDLALAERQIARISDTANRWVATAHALLIPDPVIRMLAHDLAFSGAPAASVVATATAAISQRTG